MKNRFHSNAAIIAVAITLLFASGTSYSEVHFRSVSFDQAKALAIKEHKAIMVDVYTSWCVWCKTLDRNTYSDDNVGKLADSKFIPVKIDAETGEGVSLAKEWKVTGYPTIIFFDKTGKEIDRVVGYEDAHGFTRSLQVAAAGGSKAVIGDVESAHPTTDPVKWLVAANYYIQHGDHDKSLAAFRKVLALDPGNKHGQNAEAYYGVGFLSSGDEQWKTLADAIVKYPTEVDADQANMMLIRHDFEKNDTAEAMRRTDQWAVGHPRDAATFNFFAWNAAQHGALLDRADEYSKRAIILSESSQEKAGAMDTRAEVLFKSGKATDASQLETSALALIDQTKDKKLYNELTTQKAKFDKAIAEAPSGSSK